MTERDLLDSYFDDDKPDAVDTCSYCEEEIHGPDSVVLADDRYHRDECLAGAAAEAAGFIAHETTAEKLTAWQKFNLRNDAMILAFLARMAQEAIQEDDGLVAAMRHIITMAENGDAFISEVARNALKGAGLKP